jgi:hypothetical protein
MQIIADSWAQHTKARERRIIRQFLKQRARELRGLRGLPRYFTKLVIYVWAYQQARPHIRRLREEERHLLRQGAA